MTPAILKYRDRFRRFPQMGFNFDELTIDNFAGGGGASTGIEAALGRPVDIAVNHDPVAVAYIRTLKDKWGLRENNVLTLQLMEQFPCGMLPLRENFYAWLKVFGETYSRNRNGRKQGVVSGWVEVDRYGHRPERFYPFVPGSSTAQQ